jgi:hypothetical protein
MPENNKAYAKNLYQALRQADQLNLQIICVQMPTGDDIAAAIRDRLIKAAK